MNTNKARHRTVLCNKMREQGSCPYGERCTFAHSLDELRPVSRHPCFRTRPCTFFWEKGYCPFGPLCLYAHYAEDAKSDTPLRVHTTMRYIAARDKRVHFERRPDTADLVDALVDAVNPATRLSPSMFRL